ncbi:hypothetical protein [Lishizhenia tianjinensis]|uniref:hypothetical protein n=1 Tax=Lishizhenia tianjinensis TaxID=477690 RepID=UPI0011139796|nr:hypothetical protein [Lishizhenia tianjinensis]
MEQFELWRSDTSVCKTNRDSLCYLLVHRYSCESGVCGLKKKELIQVLGEPDNKVLGQYTYQWSDRPPCNPYDYFSIRFTFRFRRVKGIYFSLP